MRQRTSAAVHETWSHRPAQKTRNVRHKSEEREKDTAHPEEASQADVGLISVFEEKPSKRHLLLKSK